MGKTRFVAEVTSHLRHGGRLVATAACLPLMAPLPLLPVADVLRTLFGGHYGLDGGAVLESCPSYVRDELARLLPEVGTAASVPGCRTETSSMIERSGSWRTAGRTSTSRKRFSIVC